MSRIEKMVIAATVAVAMVLSLLFLPTFFSVAVLVGAIWFVIARGNGYRVTAYLALAAGVIMLLLIYLFYWGDSPERDAREIVQNTGILQNTFTLDKLEGDGGDALFLARDKDLEKAIVIQTGTGYSKTYILDDVNKAAEEKEYTINNNTTQNEWMAKDFQRSFPDKYAPAFIFFLLPLILIAALPTVRKSSRGKVLFDSRDGAFLSWLLPAGPGDDARGSAGAAGTHIILLLSIVMAIAFTISMPSLSYLF